MSGEKFIVQKLNNITFIQVERETAMQLHRPDVSASLGHIRIQKDCIYWINSSSDYKRQRVKVSFFTGTDQSTALSRSLAPRCSEEGVEGEGLTEGRERGRGGWKKQCLNQC